MPVVRTRLAVALVSLAVIALELTLMRALSLRFWHHFAGMVVGVALLGFGASGTILTLLRRRIAGSARVWVFALVMAFSLSVPAAFLVADRVPLNVHFLAWSRSEVLNVAALELVMFVPFLLAAAAVGIVLMDRPERCPGHYAASLIGSGAGALVSVLLMYVVGVRGLLLAVALAGFAAGILVLPPRRLAAAAAAAVGAALALGAWLMPAEPAMSQYKMLSLVRAMPETEVLHQTEGPLGRIDVVAGPSLHHAPGLGLACTATVPPHVLLVTDGDQTSAVYDCRAREDWAFLDHTVSALAYHLRARPKTLVIGAGGGADIGLALLHGSASVVALEMNPQVIGLMRGPLAARGGRVYAAPGVTVVNREARGYLASTKETFDVIQLPAIDAFGASGAGLHAAQESYLFTVESFAAMLDRLTDRGVLCVTRWARTPPRDGLKVLDTAAQALKGKGLDPSTRLAVIRSWATVAVLASRSPFSRGDAEAVRTFATRRSFDVSWLPDLDESEANRFHVLDRPYYLEGARALVGRGREEYLESYPFEIAAATDDRPYFFHFFRARAMPFLKDRLGRRARAFVELGHLMLVAGLVQAVLMAAVMMLVPLAPGIRAVRLDGWTAATLGYFLFLGLGFMLLEMGFLQKLILYLAHPIYSAAAVISSFLVFGGLGSAFSQAWPARPRRTAAIAAGAVVCLALVYLAGLDSWLALTQAGPVLVRFLVASATMAPLAFAMGHMFPLGLRAVGEARPDLVPWAWAANGFASVAATVAAPLLAMRMGFWRLGLVAVACYAAAGLLYRFLPGDAVPGTAIPPRRQERQEEQRQEPGERREPT